MSWGAHPDTISCAMASGAGNRSGYPRGTLGWMKAYREFYATDNQNYPFGDSLAKYLAEIDAEIALLEAAPEGAVSEGFW